MAPINSANIIASSPNQIGAGFRDFVSPPDLRGARGMEAQFEYGRVSSGASVEPVVPTDFMSEQAASAAQEAASRVAGEAAAMADKRPQLDQVRNVGDRLAFLRDTGPAW